MTVLSNKILKAKKEYDDEGLEQLWECKDNLLFSERMFLYQVKKARGFRIQIGETYFRQCNVSQGNFWMFRTIPKIWDIIVKYKMYSDD